MFLSKLSIKNPVMIIMITLGLIIFGFMALKTLGVELIPTIDFPVVSITTIYPGADAKTIEEEITKKVEDEIAVINGIDQLSSTVVDNVSFSIVKFKDGVNTDTAVQDIRDKIAIVKRSLPEEAEDTVVEKLDINAVPVLSVILKAPAGENPVVVTEIAKKKVKDRIASIAGVGKVNIYGGREREIKILMNPMKVDSFGISPFSLIQLMAASSLKVPAGSIKMNNNSQDIAVKGDAEVIDVRDFMNMPLLKIGGDSTLKVQDFARVVDGLEEEESATFMGLTPAIGMEVKKQGKVNEVKLAKEIKEELKKIEKTLPEGYSIEIIGDLSTFTEAAVQGSIYDVFFGALLAMLVVLVFLMNKRAALVVAVSLPTSIIGTFLFVKAMGFSLNFMTTLALALCVGILTDDTIVVIEAILRHIREGATRIEAAIKATDEVGFAVLAAEMSLIAVFGSTIMMEGLVGQFLKEFGITVIFAILISIVVSFTVIPLFASYILKTEKNDLKVFGFMERLLLKMDDSYSKFVSLALRHRILTMFIAVIFLATGIFLTGQLKSEMIPIIDMNLFTVRVELPAETSIEKSKIVTREVVEMLSSYDWVSGVYSSIGANATKEKNQISLRIKMINKKERTVNVAAAIDIVREKIQKIENKYNAKISFISRNDSFMAESQVQVNLLSDNFDKLNDASDLIMGFMIKDHGFKDIISDNKGYKKEIIVKFDHKKMANLGVNSAESVITLRYLISGIKIAEIDNGSGDSDEIKVYIDDPYKTLEYIKNIPLKSSTVQGVRLSDVADISYNSAIIQIQRYNKNRNIKISADVATGYDLGTQMSKLRKFASKNLPEDVRLQESGMAEMMSDSFKNLAVALIISIFLIYIVLASQFNSFIHPLTIMSALPFALTGAVATLYITGMPLSIFGFIGLILLMGIVTKNSILLIDYALQLIRGGMDVTSALAKSAKTRLKPIMMTALTTIFGMIPVVISTAEGSELKHSMGWAVMGGLVFSTLVTLIIVPVIFSLIDSFSMKRNVNREKEIAKL